MLFIASIPNDAESRPPAATLMEFRVVGGKNDKSSSYQAATFPASQRAKGANACLILATVSGSVATRGSLTSVG